MSSEASANETPTPTPTPDKAAEPAPDPYAGLPEDERAAARDLDERWSKASPRERLAFVQLAEEARIAREERAAKPTAKADEKPTESDEEADDPKTLRKRLDAMERELRSRDETSRQKAERERFYGLVDDVIAGNDRLKGSKKLAAMVRDAATGRAVTTNPADVRVMVAGIVKDLSEELEAETEKYVKGKKTALDSAGEGRGGRVVSRSEVKRSKDDLSKGVTRNRAMERAQRYE